MGNFKKMIGVVILIGVVIAILAISSVKITVLITGVVMLGLFLILAYVIIKIKSRLQGG